MSEPIKVGDLVVVVYGCCAKAREFGLGVHATVLRLYENQGKLCRFCQAPTPALRAALSHEKWDSPAAWLKRIPPLEELDDVKREEEIAA